MTMLEGPPSLQWLLNPVSTTGASLPPSFQTESRAGPGIETLVRVDASEWLSSRDSSGLRTNARHPLQPRDGNPCFDRIQVPSFNTFDPQSVSQSNKRHFHEIDDRNCRVSDVNSGLASQPKPVFYKNKTAMRAPPKPKLQQQHYYSAVSGASIQPTLKDIYGNDGSMRCPYTGCPRAFDIFTQYDEMKIHYTEHANQKAEAAIQQNISYVELENVNGSCFSFAPKRCTHRKGDTLDSEAKKHPPSRHTANPVSQSALAQRRNPSSFTQEMVNHGKTSQRATPRTIYDVSHPSRASPPRVKKTGPSLTARIPRPGPGRTIYDVEHPTTRRSRRLAGKKVVDVQYKGKVR